MYFNKRVEENVYYFEGTVRAAPWRCIPPFFFSSACRASPRLESRITPCRIPYANFSRRSRPRVAHLPVLEEVLRNHSGASGNNERDDFLIKRIPVRESSRSQLRGPASRLSRMKTRSLFPTFPRYILQ